MRTLFTTMTCCFVLSLGMFAQSGISPTGSSRSKTLAGSPADYPHIMLTVPEYTPNPGSYNDFFILDIWFENDVTLTATLETPSGRKIKRNPNEWGWDSDESEGDIYFYNYLIIENKRNVYLAVYDFVTPPAKGNWKLSFSDASMKSDYDAWLVNSRVGGEYVTLHDADTDKTVTMPGTAHKAITVGAYTTNNNWLNFENKFSYRNNVPDMYIDIDNVQVKRNYDPFQSFGCASD